MIRIIYVSSAARLFSQPELEALLDSSRRNNQARGITGLLLYRAGSFMQILEGEERTVRAVYATICRDPRHTHIVQLDDSPIDQRSFGAWWMGFHRIHTAALAPGFVDFFDTASDIDQLPGRGSAAFQFMLSFREASW